jgi:hypothetical protein
MRLSVTIAAVAALSNASWLAAQSACSLQKVNGSCTVAIDRFYPVTNPTIQARRGATITVEVVNPLAFEVLSLDAQGVQSVAQSDQVASFISAAIPNLKTFLATVHATTSQLSPQGQSSRDQNVEDELARLQKMLSEARGRLEAFGNNANIVFAQIQETQLPLPRPRDQNGKPTRDSLVAVRNTPDPLNDIDNWKATLLCEILAHCASGVATFRGVVDSALVLAASINRISLLPPTGDVLLDTTAFTAWAGKTRQDIGQLSQDAQAQYTPVLDEVVSNEHVLVASLPDLSPSLASARKDLVAVGAHIEALPDKQHVPARRTVGAFTSPRASVSCVAGVTACQATFTVNSINQIIAPTASSALPTKKTLTNVVVLFAQPVFELSIGALFSSAPIRAFANQTAVKIKDGTPVPDDIVIGETTSNPTVVPFVAANWRLTDEGLLFGYRTAGYFTLAVGANPSNSTTEFASGFSWALRGVMVSLLYHLGHDIKLTQGEQKAQIWCNATAAHDAVAKCGGSPPAPSTEKFWKSFLAFGVSIRAPAVFGNGGSFTSR